MRMGGDREGRVIHTRRRKYRLSVPQIQSTVRDHLPILGWVIPRHAQHLAGKPPHTN